MILDGNAIIHRAFHAIPPLTKSDGTQVNAVYGFVSTLLSVLEKFQPDYLIATFDESGKNFRHKMFSDYKANRKETPEELGPQFALTQEVVSAMNINIKKMRNVEADDVIGSLSVKATKEGLDTIIVTGDKDTLQLVDKNVKVFTMSRGIQDMLLYDEDLVFEKLGITTKQVVDYKGLRGDASDNIPGVRGIGDKGAVSLLNKFGSLEGIYNNIDDSFIKKGIRTKLLNDKQNAFLSRELGKIKIDLDIELDLEKSKTSEISMTGARGIFQKFGFKSLLKKLPGSDQEEKTKFFVVVKDDILNVISKELEGHEVSIMLDIYNNSLKGVCASKKDSAYYFPFNNNSKKLIEEFLKNKKIKFLTYDAKKLMHQCREIGIAIIDIFSDVLLEAYVLNTGKKLDFSQLVFEILGKDRQYSQKNKQLTLDLRDEKREREIISQKANDVFLLHSQFKKDIEKTKNSQNADANVETLLKNIEMPTIKVLYNMECAGVVFDKKVFESIAKKTDKSLSALTNQIHGFAGRDFNINSTKQLREILFEELKLPTRGIKKTKTGFSTAVTELEKLRGSHPIIEKIESYRELFKLKTTYIDTLPNLISQKDNRIHSTFNQTVTSTGRLSSSSPNLQNIPIRTDIGKALREGFVADKENVLIGVDYSQIDLRCVAHVSNDTEMIKAFNNGADIHSFTASSVLNKKISEISKKERSSAKELNFGLIYGMGIRSFAKSAGLEIAQAKDFVDKYFKKFSGVKRYMEETKKKALEIGYVETLFGRRKYTHGIKSKNSMIKSMEERAAINMPIQGLAADIMKLSMIEVDKYLENKFPDKSVRIILQIHDEIILEAPEKIADEVSEDVKKIMEGIYKLKVPLVVDSAIGKHWGQL